MKWPYSDEVTAGIEQQLSGAIRVGAMYYYRTNRAQLGVRNTAVPTSAYTPFQLTIPNGPGGTVANPKPMTVTVYNLAANLASAQNNVRDNQDYLDTTYHGVEFTANKRVSGNWQMVAGLTIGQNTGGVDTSGGQSGTADLNDPNNTTYPDGIIGSDSQVAFRLSGSYTLPWDVSLAGTFIANSGYPYVSTASVSRAQAAAAGVTLTRATQTVLLSQRGDERFDAVRMLDLRLSKTFRFGTRRISPQVDVFNITNADTATGNNATIGSTYLFPSEILAPRIIRLGLAIDF